MIKAIFSMDGNKIHLHGLLFLHINISFPRLVVLSGLFSVRFQNSIKKLTDLRNIFFSSSGITEKAFLFKAISTETVLDFCSVLQLNIISVLIVNDRECYGTMQDGLQNEKNN